MIQREPLIILTGPTAVGKTKLSIELAKKINGAIISADSMQVYQYMDIGSAKITKEEMEGVPHYLVDQFMPEEEFHVVRFQAEAKKAITKIRMKGQIPIVVGGTGFYIQALLNDIDFSKGDADVSYRESGEQIGQEQGNQVLHQMLEAVDPQGAAAIHANNQKRVIRALEYYHSTNMPISQHNEEQQKKESPYNFAYFVLNDDRTKLYDQINQRVDWMMEHGLLAEVQKLKQMGYHKEMVSMQGLGYKELLDYLDGNCTLDEAIYLIKRDTRHFAKRQLTWFKREKEVIWLDKQDYQYDNKRILDQILSEVDKRGILEC